MEILVFAPHQDDEIIGCGGTLLKHKSDGDEVHIAYVTSGPDDPKRRREEAKNACDVIDAKPHFLNFNGRLVKYDKKHLKKFVEITKNINPDMVYAPHENEEDHDHKKTSELVKESSWIANESFKQNWGPKKANVKEIRFYEVWTPMKRVDISIDITNYMNKKIQALNCYNSQISFTRYDKAIKGLNQYRGIMTNNGTYAEVFQNKKIRN